MVLILETAYSGRRKSIYGFRPLAGIMVLIKNGSMKYVELSEIVSVPLRGLWFLSVGNYCT